MPNLRSDFYEAWDLTEPAGPRRSRLFSLEPISVGTADVESLTGYIARLADAHSVSTGALVSHELVPHLGRRHLEAYPDSGLSSLWRSARAVNGTLELAKDMVTALGAVTGRHELRLLTMLPWAAVLDRKGLLRHDRAWCAVCYREWQQHARPIYEPLIWSLAPVTVCPQHGQPLETRCPHPGCRRTLLYLSTRSRPGFCSLCQGWLGAPHAPGHEVTVPGGPESRHEWIRRVVGEFLAAGPRLAVPPTRDVIAESVVRCARALTGGSVSKLARLCDIDPETVHQWQHGTSLGLHMLLRVCWHLGVTPLEFVTQPSSMTLTRAAIPTGARDGWPKDGSRRHRRDSDLIRQQVQAAIEADGESPRSTAQITKDLGRRYDELYRVCPDLLRQIAFRYRVATRERSTRRVERIRTEVREAVAHLHAQGVYPSVNRVRAMLSQPVLLRLPAARQAWLDALREHGWEMGGHRTKAYQEIPSGHLDGD
jgi:hypothetical protein